MKKTVHFYFIYVLILFRLMRQYFREILYFLRAKGPYLRDAGFNPSMLLRKRTHHLERYLFSPGSYDPDFPRGVHADIMKEMDKGNRIPPAQRMWAKKIVKEYEEGQLKSGETFCPMLANEVERKPSEISKEAMMKLLKERRSRRIFKDEPLTEAEKTAICEAAQYAPSSCNRQSLYLIFVEERDLREFIASTVPGGHQFFSDAPCILIVVSDAGDYRYPDERVCPYIDGAAAVENIYLLCETMGLGCCWGSYTSFGSIMREREVRRRLRIPDSHLIVASLALGRSTQAVCEIPRDEPSNRYWSNAYGGR